MNELFARAKIFYKTNKKDWSGAWEELVLKLARIMTEDNSIEIYLEEEDSELLGEDESEIEWE